MSATELIEKVKALPPAEQATFVSLFHSWEAASNGPVSPPKKSVQMPDYAGRLKRLFPDGPIKGDPQAFWDELRADGI